MKNRTNKIIKDLFNEYYQPENIRLFLENDGLLLCDNNIELSKLIFGDPDVLVDVISGKERRFYIIQKFVKFFKVDIELFLRDVEDFAETLKIFSEVRTVKSPQIILDARVKEQIRKELKEQGEKQLSFF